MNRKPHPSPLSPAQLVDEYFIENRNRLVEVAAFLDRLDRADPAVRQDFRVQALAEAIAILRTNFGETRSASELEALAARELLGDALSQEERWEDLETLSRRWTDWEPREAGAWFFLGELYTDLPLPADGAGSSHCGSCSACIDVCPTQAIVAPYQLDARRCISYLTIELDGAIPEEFRSAIGNRIYGCDDCQLCCPWNRHAQHAGLPDFAVRLVLDRSLPRLIREFSERSLLELARREWCVGREHDDAGDREQL